MCLNNGGNIMKYDFNGKIIEPCLHSSDSEIIVSPINQFKIRLKGNEEKVEPVEELIISDTEIAFQNNEKGKQEATLIIENKKLVKKSLKLIIDNKELVKQLAELTIANKR